MNFFSAMEIAASGLSAQRTRLNVLSGNLANARTTRGADGGPYRRLDPVFQAVSVASRFPEMRSDGQAQQAFLVQVPEIRADEGPPQQIYDPQHPDADEQGFVAMPNINVVEEMVNLITASRAYESGITTMQSLKQMARSAINIGV